MVASELFSSLAAPVFAAMLFIFFLKRRSREINAAATYGTAGGDSGTHTSTEAPEVATSSGAKKDDAVANDGTAGGASGTHTSTGVPEMPTSSGANKDAAANDVTARGDSVTHTSTEAHEMATSLGYDYEVFLSFRGSDTRATFTDHLYTRLKESGIRTFKDDESLRVGEEFAPALLQAIRQSKILIPVFSKDYASSVWCLKEVVQMVERKNNGEQKIMPIFYDVAPSEVRHQTGDYREAFLSHESKKRYDQKTIGEWKAALRAVGEINGHDLQSTPDRREGAFVKTFTNMVFNELKKASLAVSDCLVSVDDQVDAIMEMIGAGTSETRIIGIHGMGGIGKTTIAKIIYNHLSKGFNNRCFLSDIRGKSETNGIECLQNQLISDILKMEGTNIRNSAEGTQTIRNRLSNEKVLILLDDVGHKDHMDALVGKRNWFGIGSKLIITTRNKDVLNVLEVDDLYEVKIMDSNQSLQLFSKHAFRRDSPLDEYIIPSNRAIGICGGLPLALEVIGSLLSRTKKEKWDGKLKELENVPPEDVQRKLEISYNALRVREKHIFLDIACLFIGYDKDIVVHFRDESNFFPNEAMEVLQNMSLIRIEKDNKVWMHDQLRDLGREKVRQESNMKIEKQSRVWDPKEGAHLLWKHKGNKEVEALRLKLDPQWQYCLTYEDFESLSKLRFLEVNGWTENFRPRLLWHESPSNVPPANENSDLLPQLRWLSWHRIPPTFNITNFSMEDVVFLDLSSSEITHDWKGWSHMEVMKNLKILNLTECNCLERTPIFSAQLNLERLILEQCESLTEIDRSICHLKSLVSLDVSSCKNLRRLPDELGRDLANLKYLSLKYCKSFERLPKTIGNLESLVELDISKTGIKELPDSIGNLELLIELDISETGIKELPYSIGNLESLIELDISETGIKELPDSIGKLKNLKVAKLSVDSMNKIPNALWTIEKLEVIDARFYDSNVEVEIGNCIYRNQSLRILRLTTARINVVPRLPESLIILESSTLDMDTFPDLSNLTNLKELMLGFSRHYDGGESDGPVEEYLMPRWIGNLSKLETLNLMSNYVTNLPTDISSLLPRLRRLRLRCPNLRCLPSPSSSLLTLDLDSACVTTLPADIRSLLPRLQELNLKCPNLRCLPSPPSSLLTLQLDSNHMTNLPADIRSLLPQLRTLVLRCPNLRCLPSPPSSLLALGLKSECVTTLPADISSLLPRLHRLDLTCPNLRCLPSLPSSLWSLFLYNFKSFGSLGDLSNLKNLLYLYISDSVISKTRGLDGSENLDLQLSELQEVGILPDLSNINQLQSLEVLYCGNLVEIQGELPRSLEYLEIKECGSLQKLPDLSSLKGLREVKIKGCGKLNMEAISLLCSEKAVRFEGDETN